MRMTIPIVGFNRSGGVKTLVLLANAMVDRGWRVRLIVPDYAGGSPFEMSPRIEVRRVRTASSNRALQMAAFYLRLAKTMARDTDVCVANFYLTAYCAWTSRLLHRGARAIYFLQGDEAESHGRLADAPPLSRWIRRILARGSYRLPIPMFCVSNWLRRHVRRPDAVVVGQGIDPAVFREAPRDGTRARVVVGTIGGAAPVKGYQDVVAALGTLTGQAFDLVVASAEPVAMPAGISARRVAGSREADMADFYRDCDVFVFASHREGFGLPPLEAMASGCAVVTTDCGGVSDFAIHEDNCLIVPVGDAPAIAAAVAQLIGDAALRGRLAAGGIRTAAAWPRERMMAAFADQVALVAG